MKLRDRTALEAELRELYGVPPEALAGLSFYETSGDRVYVATVDVDPHALRAPVHRVGVYLGKREPQGLRLSMEGAWLLAPHVDAARVLEVDETTALAWLRGASLPAPHDAPPGFLLLRRGADVLGCTVNHGGKLHNRVPKNRRIRPEGGDAAGTASGPPDAGT